MGSASFDELTVEGQETLLRAVQARARLRQGIDVESNARVLDSEAARAALAAFDSRPLPVAPLAAPAPRMGVVLPFRRPTRSTSEPPAE